MVTQDVAASAALSPALSGAQSTTSVVQAMELIDQLTKLRNQAEQSLRTIESKLHHINKIRDERRQTLEAGEKYRL